MKTSTISNGRPRKTLRTFMEIAFEFNEVENDSDRFETLAELLKRPCLLCVPRPHGRHSATV